MYELIERKRLDSSTSSVVFSSIPQIYSDLVVMCSVKSTNTANTWTDIQLRPNGATTGFSGRTLYGYGTTKGSNTDTNPSAGQQAAVGSSIFSSSSVYITNYSSSTSKSWSVDSTTESNDSASSIRWLAAYSWSGTDPITSLTLQSIQHSFDQNSTFTLYGVNRRSGIGAPKAVGGNITYSNGYWVHTFTGSSTFYAQEDLEVDALIVAGGGGGGRGEGNTGGDGAGGGGAGGYRMLSQQISTGAYSVLVGSGGTGSSSSTARGVNGSDSAFLSLIATGGGGGGTDGTGVLTGSSGGSGGGAAANFGSGSQSGGSPVSGQGFAGGSTNNTSQAVNNRGGAGGGGGGAAGSNQADNSGGAGGIGIFWNGGYYAGGGGGGSAGQDRTEATGGTGGLGGGGTGGNKNVAVATNGTANTGGGGGGGSGASGVGFVNGAAGGSGIVIIRYKA